MEEEENLLSVVPPWLAEIIIFSVETGCRRGEMFSLEWMSVDLYRRVITIHATKTSDKRSIPLTQRSFKILQQKRKDREKIRFLKQDLVFSHPHGNRVNIHTHRTAFTRALKHAGIFDFRWHDLRHTFASRLAQAGVDPYSIQRLMGHKCFSTTQRYAHHYVESLRRGIESMESSRLEEQRNVAQK